MARAIGINASLERKLDYIPKSKCQMFVYSGHALSYTRKFTGMPLKLRETNISNEHNRLKNPNWREADQLAIYKHNRGAELEYSPIFKTDFVLIGYMVGYRTLGGLL